MTVKGEPAGAAASTVAKELGKELKFAADLRPKLEQRVNFMVKDVTLEELLNQALDPLGLRYQVTDAELEILAKE
jgi:hypothetical protein